MANTLYEIITRSETTNAHVQVGMHALADVAEFNQFYDKLGISQEILDSEERHIGDIMYPRGKRVIGVIGVNRSQSGIYQLDITQAEMKNVFLKLHLVDKIPSDFQGGSMLSVAGCPVLVVSIPYDTRHVQAMYAPEDSSVQQFDVIKLDAKF